MSSSSELTLELSSKTFNGYQYVYSHDSYMVGCTMKFGIYVPSIADCERVPLLIFLSDFRCNEQSFITKSGMQRLASKYGFIVANPDTSPRDCLIEGDSDQWSFGDGAGYYIDATQPQWSDNYQMFSYVNDEFYELIINNFNVDINRIGILGHGMGGHGALISFLKCPTQYKSVSAFSPICDALKCEWTRNAFKKFLGPDETKWKEYDTCELVSSYAGLMPYAPVLIDQGSSDPYKDDYLFQDRFIEACTNGSFPIQWREQIGYDHDYYFIMTFLEDHFRYHKQEFENST